MYSPGDCVFIETNYNLDGTSKAHLFIIIYAALNNLDTTILFPLCTIPRKGYYDNTVVFDSGDHDFIKKPTYVHYRESKLKTKLWLDQNTRIRKPPADEIMLKRIINGITVSIHTPNEVYD